MSESPPAPAAEASAAPGPYRLVAALRDERYLPELAPCLTPDGTWLQATLGLTVVD